MSTKEQDLDDAIEVEELKDGTAEVEIPEELAPPEEVNVAEGGSADDDALREAKRDRRRAKRDLARKTSAEKDQRLTYLARQNEELMQRLAAIEQKSRAGDIERVDRALQDEELRLQYAKSKVSEAASNQNGEALTRAQEMWFDAQKKVEALRKVKEYANSAAAQRPQVDAIVMNNAKTWIDRNKWYDPNGNDTDSKIAKQLDETLTQEGWDPKSEEYWNELDDRLQKYLPHRYNRASGNQNRPRNMQTSSGRESYSGDRRTITLSAEQVRAMKDAGMWDDPAKRDKMIKRYAKESRKYVEPYRGY